MKTLLAYLPALACAGAMVVCLRMMRGHGSAKATDTDRELNELREEVERLKNGDKVPSGRKS